MIGGLRKLDYDPFGGGNPERASEEERGVCIGLAIFVVTLVCLPVIYWVTR